MGTALMAEKKQGVDFDPMVLSDAELRERLARGLGATVDGLKDMAVCWRELEKRGHDLSELRSGMGRYVSLIAAGRLTPEIVVAFLGEPAKIRAVEGVALPRQLQIATGANVAFYDPNKKAVVEVPLSKLPPENLGYVFRNGREVPTSEQAIIHRPVKRDTGRQARQITVDRQNNSIKIGQTNVPIAKVMGAMADAAGRQGNIDLNKHAAEQRETENFSLTADEKQRIHDAAKAAGLPKSEWIRRACLACLV